MEFDEPAVDQWMRIYEYDIDMPDDFYESDMLPLEASGRYLTGFSIIHRGAVPSDLPKPTLVYRIPSADSMMQFDAIQLSHWQLRDPVDAKHVNPKGYNTHVHVRSALKNALKGQDTTELPNFLMYPERVDWTGVLHDMVSMRSQMQKCNKWNPWNDQGRVNGGKSKSPSKVAAARFSAMKNRPFAEEARKKKADEEAKCLLDMVESGATHEQIADEFKVLVGGVQTKIDRARNRLAEAVEPPRKIITQSENCEPVHLPLLL